MMAETEGKQAVPTPEKVLRDLAKNASKAIPRFEEKEPITGVKELHDLVDPLLETADLPDLNPGHRAAASNALCSIIEACQASKSDHVREAILNDSIWLRLFNIYLQRSDDAKGKSMRQMLLLLTGVITKDQSTRAFELRLQAAATFVDIICDRQDRIKVKPALQGLAHFLLRDVVSIAQLLEIYGAQTASTSQSGRSSPQTLFKACLIWVVHHDTSLSAGHLVKNFLIQARRLPNYGVQADSTAIAPLWIEPVVDMLHEWPDRLREFKANVFPHCFLPNIDEYLRLLSYLRFNIHVRSRGDLPQALRTYESRRNGLEKSEEFRILLAALETGKELTIVRDIDYRVCDRIEVQGNHLHLPDDIFGTWMSHSEPEVRLAGMFLSVHSTAITKPMTGGVFKSLKRNLIHLHTDTDAYFRREVHGYTQKLFDRLRASTATLSKGLIKGRAPEQGRLPFPKECFQQRSTDTGATEDSLADSLAFIVWYTRFLGWELRSTGTYQRRITALRSLIITLKSGVDAGVPRAQLSKSAQGELNWAHTLQISNPGLTRLLLDLVMDPFDDIREAAISVLQLCLAALPDAERALVLATLPRFISRAEATMLRTGRADQADGVARAYSLLFAVGSADTAVSSKPDPSRSGVFDGLREQLTQTLDIARTNLSEAVNGRPVHGIYAALTYIVDQDGFYPSIANEAADARRNWVEAHNELITSFESLWAIVYNVLCADAPEGNVPDEVDEAANMDTREVLSYSWRGLKEASVLIRTIITKASIGNDDKAIIAPSVFEKLGRLCFTQLLELRHRGAHSTVAQTFAAFCRRCATSKIPELQTLPDTWYQETIRSMQDKAGAITRRSAGIPTLMASIIAAEPEASSKLLGRAMKDLIKEASVEAQHTNIEESRLPQVHALNCIKEIFTTSKLSVASEAYIAQGLELAAKTLNSNIWPIRNCSLMLFKALIERLLGSSEAQDWKEQDRAKTSRFSYDNYPSLLGILANLLDPSGPRETIENNSKGSNPFDLHGAEGVFPALQILRQARPPTSELAPIRASVEKLLASPHWHMRDMAARTVVSLLPQHEMYDAAFKMLGEDHSSINTRHGVLLAVKYMMRKLANDQFSPAAPDIEAILLELLNCVDRWFTHNACPFIDAVLFDIISICGLSILQRQESESVLVAWTQLTSAVNIGPEYELGVGDESDSPLRTEALARLFMVDRVIVRPESLGVIVSEDYQSIGDALMLLAAEDPDTCCAALEAVETIVKKAAFDAPKKPKSLLMAHVHRIVLNAEDPEVISHAQRVLAEAFDGDSLRRAEFFSLLTEPQLLGSLAKLEDQCLTGTPSDMQSALHLLGFFLEHTYQSLPSARAEVLAATKRYIRLLRMTIIDTNPFDTRFAAAQSVCALHNIWTARTSTSAPSPHVLGLGLLLYDMLQDDDDEIRDLAALATSTFISTTSSTPVSPTVPILATQQLFTHLLTLFPKSSALATHSLHRLTATQPPSALFATSFEAVLNDVTKPQTALFAQEKQNLFKDDALDALSWSRVLSSPGIVGALPAPVLESAATWIRDALAVLTARYEAEVDGALGWASKAEVFTWVIRVMCLSEVILQGGGKGKTEVKLGLAKLVAAMGTAEGHAVVVKRAEKVLEEDVLRSLGMLKGVAKEAPGYAVSWLEQ
ncbi:hypothetical protein E8E11_011182 [Didymella keratinophila]|nr:hypothetical protein E8E11_011182 [Didymella keratinophila]